MIYRRSADFGDLSLSFTESMHTMSWHPRLMYLVGSVDSTGKENRHGGQSGRVVEDGSQIQPSSALGTSKIRLLRETWSWFSMSGLQRAVCQPPKSWIRT